MASALVSWLYNTNKEQPAVAGAVAAAEVARVLSPFIIFMADHSSKELRLVLFLLSLLLLQLILPVELCRPGDHNSRLKENECKVERENSKNGGKGTHNMGENK